MTDSHGVVWYDYAATENARNEDLATHGLVTVNDQLVNNIQEFAAMILPAVMQSRQGKGEAPAKQVKMQN